MAAAEPRALTSPAFNARTDSTLVPAADGWPFIIPLTQDEVRVTTAAHDAALPAFYPATPLGFVPLRGNTPGQPARSQPAPRLAEHRTPQQRARHRPVAPRVKMRTRRFDSLEHGSGSLKPRRSSNRPTCSATGTGQDESNALKAHRRPSRLNGLWTNAANPISA